MVKWLVHHNVTGFAGNLVPYSHPGLTVVWFVSQWFGSVPLILSLNAELKVRLYVIMWEWSKDGGELTQILDGVKNLTTYRKNNNNATNNDLMLDSVLVGWPRRVGKKRRRNKNSRVEGKRVSNDDENLLIWRKKRRLPNYTNNVLLRVIKKGNGSVLRRKRWSTV